MMKKQLFLLAVIMSMSMYADNKTCIIPLKKVISIVAPLPTPNPTAVVDAVSAVLSYHEIFVLAEQPIKSITIYNMYGWGVLSVRAEDFVAGEGVSIDVSDCIEGRYVLCISCDDASYVGFFEL